MIKFMARISKKVKEVLELQSEVVENPVAETYTQDGVFVQAYETIGEAQAAALASGENLIVETV